MVALAIFVGLATVVGSATASAHIDGNDLLYDYVVQRRRLLREE